MGNLVKQDLKSLMSSEDVMARLKEILGKRASTFATSVLQIANSNDLLKDAIPQSIVGASMTAATLDLPLNNNLGYAYIIPFREKQKDGTYLTKAQFQIGYKGFVQLAMRSGQFKTINVTDVKEGEKKEHNRMSGEIEFDWMKDDKERLKAKTVGYLAYFKLLNGFESFLYMSNEELNVHAKRFSQTFKKGFGLWKDDYNSMASKTVLKLLLSKYAPLSIEMQNAVLTDQATFNDVDGNDYHYIDNEPEVLDPELVSEAKENERIKNYIKDAGSLEQLNEVKDDLSTDEQIELFKIREGELQG